MRGPWIAFGIILLIIAGLVCMQISHEGDKYYKPEFDQVNGKCIKEMYKDWGGGNTFIVFDNLDTLRIRSTRYRVYYRLLPHHIIDSATVKTN